MLFYDLSQRDGAPLYDYLYKCIRHDIAHGAIAAGEKLPSKRALAKHLGVGVITVEAAYTQLVAEGYVRAEERRGYFACELAPAVRAGALAAGESSPLREGASAPHDAALSRGTQGPQGASPAHPAFSGSAATALFPYATWSKVMRQTLSEEGSRTLADAASAKGSLRLRRAIASYLRDYRGMDVSAECIVVGAGSQTLYQLLVQLLGRGKTYAVEAPGYPLLMEMYRAQDACVVEIPVTPCGIDVDALRASGAEVAHVMPAHQFPTGAVMSAACRRSLLNWSRGGAGAPGHAPQGRFVVEDDYDAEFRMAGRPIPPLASIDSAGRVVYLNSFAKSLGAAFRIAYMVLPPALLARFDDELGFYSNTVSPLEQLALARFIEQGHYERHVNRLRARAKRAQDALVAALVASSPEGALGFTGLDGGFHFSVSFETEGCSPEGAAQEEDAGTPFAAQEDAGATSFPCEATLRKTAREHGARISPIGPGCYMVNFEEAVAAGAEV